MSHKSSYPELPVLACSDEGSCLFVSGIQGNKESNMSDITIRVTAGANNAFTYQDSNGNSINGDVEVNASGRILFVLQNTNAYQWSDPPIINKR